MQLHFHLMLPAFGESFLDTCTPPVIRALVLRALTRPGLWLALRALQSGFNLLSRSISCPFVCRHRRTAGFLSVADGSFHFITDYYVFGS